MARNLHLPDGLPQEIAGALKMHWLDTIAGELVDLGYAAEAIPLLSEAFTLAQVVDLSTLSSILVDVIVPPVQVGQHVDAAIEAMSRSDLAPLAGRLITEATEVKAMNKDASQSKQAKPHQQALDLVLMVHPRELDKSTVRSLLAESLAACDAKQLAALDEPLEAMRKSHPDDLSIAIATALRVWPATTRSERSPPSKD